MGHRRTRGLCGRQAGTHPFQACTKERRTASWRAKVRASEGGDTPSRDRERLTPMPASASLPHTAHGRVDARRITGTLKPQSTPKGTCAPYACYTRPRSRGDKEKDAGWGWEAAAGDSCPANAQTTTHAQNSRVRSTTNTHRAIKRSLLALTKSRIRPRPLPKYALDCWSSATRLRSRPERHARQHTGACAKSPLDAHHAPLRAPLPQPRAHGAVGRTYSTPRVPRVCVGGGAGLPQGASTCREAGERRRGGRGQVGPAVGSRRVRAPGRGDHVVCA